MLYVVIIGAKIQNKTEIRKLFGKINAGKRKNFRKNLAVSEKLCTFAPAFDENVSAKLKKRIGI
jgi:hypothetical protein